MSTVGKSPHCGRDHCTTLILILQISLNCCLFLCFGVELNLKLAAKEKRKDFKKKGGGAGIAQ